MNLNLDIETPTTSYLCREKRNLWQKISDFFTGYRPVIGWVQTTDPRYRVGDKVIFFSNKKRLTSYASYSFCNYNNPDKRIGWDGDDPFGEGKEDE